MNQYNRKSSIYKTLINNHNQQQIIIFVLHSYLLVAFSEINFISVNCLRINWSRIHAPALTSGKCRSIEFNKIWNVPISAWDFLVTNLEPCGFIATKINGAAKLCIYATVKWHKSNNSKFASSRKMGCFSNFVSGSYRRSKSTLTQKKIISEKRWSIIFLILSIVYFIDPIRINSKD